MVTPTGVGIGVAATVIGGLILREIWRWRESSIQKRSEQQDWYAETVSICQQALQALRTHQDSGPPTFDETRMEMRTAGSQLSRHAGDSVGLEVVDDVVESVRDASEACQALNNAQTYVGDASQWDDAFEEAQAALQRARDEAEARL